MTPDHESKAVLDPSGFVLLACEWWHFCLEKEPYPDVYFDFPVSSDYLRR